MDKKEYIPPILEVFEYEVERGFAQSMMYYEKFIGNVQNESVVKGDTYYNNDSLWSNHEWY